MEFGFDGFSTMFSIAFVLILGIFATILVKGILQWNKNNHSPRLTVDASVVAKRMDVSHHSQGNAGDPTGAHGFHTTSSTSYFVTFQVESGDRMEFSVSGAAYGMLAEGDIGKLSFQGSRYLGFDIGG